MVEQKYLYSGIAGLIALLVGFGGSMLLTQDQLDNAYVCPSNENWGFFHRLSSTKISAYYFDSEGVERSKRCSVAWVSLKSYAESKGIDPLLFLQQTPPEQVSSTSNAPAYCCTPEGCYPKIESSC